MPTKRTIFIKALLISFFLINCLEVIAKEPPTPPGEGGPSGPGLPIDSGIIYLLLAAFCYGIYELKNRK
jgi:hypothetical protein